MSLITLRSFQTDGSFSGVVIEKKKSYVILFDGLEKIYFKTNDVNIDLFDIIQVNGKLSEFSPYKKPLESGFDFAKYLSDKGVNREVVSYSYTTIFNNPINIVQYKNKIIALFPDVNEAVIVKGLLLGESSYDNDMYLTLKSSGLLVLLNLSGLLVNSLFFYLNKLFSIKFNQKISQALSLIIVFPILFLNIDSPSIIRIFIYRFIVYYFIFKNKKINYLELKTISFLALIISDHHLINSVSMQLSMVISFGLYFSNAFIKSKNKLIQKLYFHIVLFFLFLPFNLQFNQCLNALNNVINIVFIPINSMLLALLLPTIFMIKLPFVSFLLSSHFAILDSLNLKYLNINGPPLNQYLLTLNYFILFALLYFLESRNKYIYKKIQMALVAFQCFYFLPINNFLYFTVSFINVGQGDSALLVYKNKTILVDTGGSLKEDIATSNLIPFLRKNRIYKIDYLFITHYDMDHYYASISLKRNFIVQKIYDYNNFKELKISDLTIYNINTNIDKNVEENDKSLVLHCSTPSTSLLLMGDASKNVEYKIMREYPNIRATYLKCGHHGSDTSTSAEFVKWLKPKEAIISCGEKNKYGHPHKEVIEELKRENVLIRRTDEEGTITYRFFY